MAAAEQYINKKHLLTYTMEEQLVHGMDVSNLAYALAAQMGFPEEFCYQMAVAGMVHDIGKIRLMHTVEEMDNPLMVEEMKIVRMHSKISHEMLEKEGYEDFILESVLYHHENYDGTGYPENLAGEQIPLGARILRVCDVYSALTADRPYRRAFEKDAAVELMIDEVKNFDLKVFLAFQRMIHTEERRKVHL